MTEHLHRGTVMAPALLAAIRASGEHMNSDVQLIVEEMIGWRVQDFDWPTDPAEIEDAGAKLQAFGTAFGAFASTCETMLSALCQRAGLDADEYLTQAAARLRQFDEA